jgi:hypothetical protein
MRGAFSLSPVSSRLHGRTRSLVLHAGAWALARFEGASSGAEPVRSYGRLGCARSNQVRSHFHRRRRGPRLAKRLLLGSPRSAPVRPYRQCYRLYTRRLDRGFLLHEAPDRVAKLGRALRDCGGLLVRMEASGASSPWEPWLEQLESGAASQMYASAVLLVQDDDGTMFTCGMHHFDLPDAQISCGDPSDAMAWLDAFCVYQLAEQPTLRTGHTFRPKADVPKRKIERWPDHRHHQDDGRHNTFGLWRFLEPGEPGLSPTNPVLVLMPSLVSKLLAAERARGQPLAQGEVEATVNESSAVAMDPADAAKLERSRGYADIEPELAWRQWLLVRDVL